MLNEFKTNKDSEELLREIYINGFTASRSPVLSEMLSAGLVKEIPGSRFVLTPAGLSLALSLRNSSPEWQELSERILCVEGSRIRPLILPKGLTVGVEKQIEEIINSEPVLIPRRFAEETPFYKQIISYVSIIRGDEVFATHRLSKGGEARLHGLISLGIGGHMNPELDGSAGDILSRGLRREIEEEVDIRGSVGALVPRGIINDDTNEVGSVHAGFFYTLETDGDVFVRETEKLEGLWLKRNELESLCPGMETWSQIIVPVLAKL